MFVLQRNEEYRACDKVKEINVQIKLIDSREELFKEKCIWFGEIPRKKSEKIDQQIFKLSAELIRKGYDVDVRPVLDRGVGYGDDVVHDGYFAIHSKCGLKRGDLSLILLSAFYYGNEMLPDLKKVYEETEDGNRIIWENNSQRFSLTQFYNDMQTHSSPYLSKIIFLNEDNNGKLFENLSIKKEIDKETNSCLHVVTYHRLSMQYFLRPKFKSDLNIIREIKILLQ